MGKYLSQLMARPTSPGTRLSRYTEACGYFYLALGASFFFFPNAQSQLGWVPPFQGQEEALFRAIGMTVGIIGYFYIFGGRSQSRQFGLASVLDRLLIPVMLFSIYATSNADLMLVVPLSILDPLLGLGAYWAWLKDEAEQDVG